MLLSALLLQISPAFHLSSMNKSQNQHIVLTRQHLQIRADACNGLGVLRSGLGCLVIQFSSLALPFLDCDFYYKFTDMRTMTNFSWVT